MPADEGLFLRQLEVEVEAELVMTRTTDPDEALALSPADWLFDPTDLEREEVGLRGLLGAVHAMECDVPLPLPEEKDESS